MTLPEIKDELVANCRAYWESTKGHAYLLQRAGEDLGNEKLREIKRKYKGLKDFVDNIARDSVDVIPKPGDRLTFGIIPVGVPRPSDDSAMFESVGRVDTRRKPGPRFKPSVWNAFTKPIGAGLKRWVDPEDKFRFRDQTDASSQASLLEVLTTDLAHGNADIEEKVRGWSERNDVAFDELLFSNGTAASHGVRADNLLEAILGALDDRELARVSLPLDVVKKLRTIKR